MASIESQIINDIIEQLRSSELFAKVIDGEMSSDSAVPAAAVISDGWQEITQRGLAGKFEKLYSMSIRLTISTRSSSAAQGVARLTELANSAVDVLMVDMTRGGFCCNLPDGEKATAIDRMQIDELAAGSRRQLVLHIYCHYRKAAAASFAGPSIDGETLFSSGPSEIVCESWPRETIRRGFAGINGEAVLDMGRRSRQVTQRGILSADSVELLQSTVGLIEAKSDGTMHTMIDADGVTFSKVLLEKFDLTSPTKNCGVIRCEYEIIYRQLP